MNENLNAPTLQDCSSIQVEILLEESWIDKFLAEKMLTIPLNDQYTLSNLKINLGDGTLNFQADLEGKEGTSIEVTSRPEWDAATQRISINDLKLKTDTRNILLKSAGWLAQTFLQSKIDKKLEEQANQMYRKQLQKLREKPIEIPMPNYGTAVIRVASITITDLQFINQAISVKATIDAYPKVRLT